MSEVSIDGDCGARLLTPFFTGRMRRPSARIAWRVGVLAAVASGIAGTETNIDQVSLEERDVNSSSLKFQLQVRDRKHLASVIRTIRRMPDVQRVFRTLA